MSALLATPSDEALVAAVGRQDESALGILYDRHGATCYRLALRIVRDPSLAEDVVQEAFIDLWRSARSFEAGRGRGRSWILVITHRRAVDLVRREERRRAEPLRGFNGVGDEGADILVERKGERARLQNALEMLSVDQRRTLELAYYGGLTQSELRTAGRAARHDQEPHVPRAPAPPWNPRGVSSLNFPSIL
ncbi:MAG TPA: sigma-70 family RNA polymerase sigma factor [Gaiellaceae bacterium]|nr:sigma-70 family RNA polymerase sigma factor [Gaiellaceae bacterium]